MYRPPVFQRRHLELFFKYGCEFALIGIAYLFGDLGHGQPGGGEEHGGVFHPGFAEVGGDILAVDAAEIIFQAGLADGKLRGKFPRRMVLAQVGGNDFFNPFGNIHLGFREKGADLGRWNIFYILQQGKKSKRIDLHLCYSKGQRKIKQCP